MMFKNILVVCTGNICRSPIGEYMLREKLPKANVTSAGIAAMVGWPANETSVEVSAANGLDLSGHVARQATKEMLSAQDLILVMDQSHVNWLRNEYPSLAGRVHKWLKWRKEADVPDPYKRPKVEFERAYSLIADGVSDWLPKLGG